VLHSKECRLHKVIECNFFAAEFIVNLADKHPTFESFKKVLIENGATFSVRIFKICVSSKRYMHNTYIAPQAAAATAAVLLCHRQSRLTACWL